MVNKLNVVAMILASLMLLSSVSAWRESNYGLVLWEKDCDFVDGNVRDLDVVESSSEECSGKCLERHGCDHFTWNGKCILKTAPASEKLRPLSYLLTTAICGFIPSKCS